MLLAKVVLYCACRRNYCANMSSGKAKTRRYSLPSLGSSPAAQQSGVQEDQDQVVASSVDPISSSARTDGSTRKRALKQAEVNSDAKRPALAINNSDEAVSKEQLQVSEHTLCCLPGGVYA